MNTDITVVITNWKRPVMLWQAFQSCQKANVQHVVVTSSAADDAVKAVHSEIVTVMPTAVIISEDGDSGNNTAWLRGVEAAKTRYVTLLHDDDLLLPEFDLVQNMPEPGTFTLWNGKRHGFSFKPDDWYEFLNEPEGLHGTALLTPILMDEKRFSISPVAGLFFRDDLLDVLDEAQRNFGKEFFTSSTMMVGNDLLIWLRAAEKYREFRYVRTPIVSFGNHAGSTTCAIPGKLVPIYQATRKYFASNPISSKLSIPLEEMPSKTIFLADPTATVELDELITFKHSGEIGDTLYSLPVLRNLAACGHAKLLIGQSHLTRVKDSGQQQRIVDAIKPLLLATQPWIVDVEVHRGEMVRYDLDRWRAMPASYSRLTRTLAECHAMAFGLGMELFRQPWISLAKVHSDPDYRTTVSAFCDPVVIHRSARYQNPWFPWKAILDCYKGKILMVGLPDEHEAFCREFSVELPHVNTQDFLELALVIEQARLFIGNQSSPFALAEAMKKPVIQEVCLAIGGQGNPNCIFRRRWAQHVATANWKPWLLEDLPEYDLSEQPTYA